MAVGANSVRPPLFAYMVCTNSTPRNSSKRDVVFLQSRNCAAPLQVFGQVSAAAKSLRSLRIYVLLWDRIAVQIVLLRYFFCLIAYFYMLLILQSAPSRLSPNEALPHTPLGALPLDPTSPLALGLSVRFISRFARCFIFTLCLQFTLVCYAHSSFLPSSLKIRPHILQFTSKCAIIISIGGLIHEKTLFRNFYELFRLRHDNFLGCSRNCPRLLFH